MKLQAMGVGVDLTGKQMAIMAGVITGVAVLAVWFVVHETKKGAVAVANAVNPVSQNNIFNEGFNAVTKAVTGGSDETFGEKLATWINGPGVTPDPKPVHAVTNSVGAQAGATGSW